MSRENMANYITIPFAASVATQTAFDMVNDLAGNLVRAEVEALGSEDVVIELEDGLDGVTYAAVAGTSNTVKPGGAVVLAANVGKYFRLRQSGGYGRIVLSLDGIAQQINEM